MTEERRMERIGVLWFGKDRKDRDIVTGTVNGVSVYGYINDVKVKNGPNTGKTVKAINIYKARKKEQTLL